MNPKIITLIDVMFYTEENRSMCGQNTKVIVVDHCCENICSECCLNNYTGKLKGVLNEYKTTELNRISK